MSQRAHHIHFNEGTITPEVIDEIHDCFDKHKANEQDSPAAAVKNVNVSMVKWGDLKHLLAPIEQQIFHINQYLFGYNIWPQSDNNNIHLNEYNGDVKGEYQWHTDGMNDWTSDIKFTVLINVSKEDYTGGDFSLFGNGPSVFPEVHNRGGVFMFKSATPHKVDPVLSGKRHTVSLWYYGPRFI